MGPPQPTVAGDFVAPIGDRAGKVRGSLSGAATHQKGCWGLGVFKRIKKPPQPDAGSIGENLFLALIADAFGYNA